MKNFSLCLSTLAFAATLLMATMSAQAQSVDKNSSDVCVDDDCEVVQLNRVFILTTGTNTDLGDNVTQQSRTEQFISRLSVGVLGETMVVVNDENPAPNGSINAVVRIGGRSVWLEGIGGFGGGPHGIGWNVRGSLGVMFRCGSDTWSCGFGGITSRWRYDRKIEGNATHYDRILNGGFVALGHDFGPLEARIYGAFGREGHETKAEVEKGYAFEAGFGLSKSYDFLK